jgi:hypothetical protein
MKNFARFGLGTDITKLVGYAMTTTNRIGLVSLQFENLGTGLANSLLANNVASSNPTTNAVVKVMSFAPTTLDAKGLGVPDTNGVVTGSWTQLIAPFTIVPGGRVEKQAVVFSKVIGIFGSGLTTVSLEIPHTHAAALRGGHIDVEPVSRQGYGFDVGIDRNQLFPLPLV